MKWWKEFRRGKALEKSLANMSMPKIPYKVEEAWFQIPKIQERHLPKALRPAPWIACIMIMIAVFLLPNGGVEAFAQVIRDTRNPERLINMNPGKCFSSLIASPDNMNTFGLLMIGLAALAILTAIMVAVSQKRKTGQWPDEFKNEKLNWFQIVMMSSFNLLAGARKLAEVSTVFKTGAALIIPGVSLAFVLALIVMSVLLQMGEQRLVQSMKRMMYTLIVVFLGLIMNASFIQPILHGLSPVFWWIGVAQAVALTPVFIRLGISAGYFSGVSIYRK